MEKVTGSRSRLSSRRNARVILLLLLALGIFCGAGWMFLNKGLYLLPDKMCEGTLERNTVQQLLPRTRSADSGSDIRGSGGDLAFWCHVTTSDRSAVSGEAKVRPVSRAQWLDYYQNSGTRKIMRVSMGDMQALAQIDPGETTSSVYVPCEPSGVPAYKGSQPYAVVGEARVDGSAGLTGVPLHQALTDFAYRLTEHAYKLAGCKAHRDFPERLPRYGGR
ncbi:hypothetical protein [Streptomyces sp. NPDC005573]|uniref:hypothetical protein n=1 Tax=Streptomyces sp. NPDC005573 TaxID=3156890 RepID=UPI0033B8345F